MCSPQSTSPLNPRKPQCQKLPLGIDPQCFLTIYRLWYDKWVDIHFDKILASLLPKKGDGSVVGIDIGSAFIKATQLRKKGGKVMLDTYGEIALGPVAGLEVGQATSLPVEKIVEVIKDLFAEANITSRDIVIALPLTSTLLTVIEMPDLGEEKLKEMIPLEARKYVPTSVSEVSLSHWVVPRLSHTYIDPDKTAEANDLSPKVDVLLAAVHNDVLARMNDIGKRIGATTLTLEIEIFSTIRSTIGKDSSVIMILDIGAANTKVALIEEGIVRSSHLVNVGSQDVTLALAHSKGVTILQAEETKREFGLLGDPSDPSVSEITRLSVERIFSEANHILGRYQHEKHVVVEKVVLTGGGALLKGIMDIAQKSFEVNVIFGNAFAHVEAPAVLESVLKEAGPEFAVSVGLALRKL